MNVDFISLFGGVMIILGSITAVRAYKKRGWDRARNIILGILFAMTGVALLRPAFERGRQNEMLNLQPNAVSKITVYDSTGGHRNTLAQIYDKELLSEWAGILRTCKYILVNHPDYEKTYTVEVEYNGDTLNYQLDLDSRQPNTVDLQPFDKSTVLSINVEVTHGIYRCEGLYGFVLKTLPPTN